MEQGKVRFSIRYKLLLLLTILPVICLSLYLFMATSLFEKDKIAYVYDSSTAVARSLSGQTRMELAHIISNLKPIFESFDRVKNDFSSSGKESFNRQKKIKAIELLTKTANGYSQPAILEIPSAKAEQLFSNPDWTSQWREKAEQYGFYITKHPTAVGSIVMAQVHKNAAGQPEAVSINVFDAPELTDTFLGASAYQNYLIHRKGEIAISPEDSNQKISFKNLLELPTSEGTSEVNGVDGTAFLASFSDIGFENWTVVSIVDKAAALKTVDVLMAKSILFFISLISSTLIISLFASGRMTSTLRELFDATKKMAQGQFDVKIKVDSNDEVGGLAQGFQWMAAEVSRLMKETAEKARMESELSTVKTVQETLFPEAEGQFAGVKVRGHFEPASECGGDWWSYSKVGDKMYVWIGDATGHGAPAALVTSAARSAAAIIESIPDITPGKAMEVLNHAIHQTSRGKILMTFLIASIDTKTGEVVYANASHEVPYILKKVAGRAGSKKDLVPILEVNGPRLGEKDHTKYEEGKFKLEAGEILALYTDGVLDIQNTGGEKIGERNFLKALAKLTTMETPVIAKMESLTTDLNSYRSGTMLIDDVTLMLCEYEKAS